MTFGAKGPMQMTFTNVFGLGQANKDLWGFPAKSQGNPELQRTYESLDDNIELVTDQTFCSAELIGRTSTVWFGPNDRTFFLQKTSLFSLLQFDTSATCPEFFCVTPKDCIF